MAERENGNKRLNDAAEREFGRLLGWFIALLLFVRILERLPEILGNIRDRFVAFFTEGLIGFFFSFLYVLGIVITLGFIAGILYTIYNYNRINAKEKQALDAKTKDALGHGSEPVNERWVHVMDHISQEDEEHWRLAIIEADAMLDEMLTTLGYTQASVGEKLQAVEKSDFNTIDEAWEAHKMRNIIAHEGSQYQLTKREARQTIDLYRQVFDEFSYL